MPGGAEMQPELSPVPRLRHTQSPSLLLLDIVPLLQALMRLQRTEKENPLKFLKYCNEISIDSLCFISYHVIFAIITLYSLYYQLD